MWFHSLFDRRNSTAPRARTGHRRRTTRKPLVEALEDRTLLNFSPAVNYPVTANPLDMVVGDFNGDGKADLVTINATQVSVLPGNGDGTFGTAQTITAGSGLRSVAAGNFNGDARLDLVISSSVTTWNGTAYVTTGAVLVLLNSTAVPGSPVTFQAARSFSSGTNLTPGAVAVGDLNGDGKADVAVVQAGGGNVSVLQGDGAGNLGTPRQVAVGTNPASVVVGDLDGDGRLELVTANQGSNDLSVLRNAGNDAAGAVQFQPATSAAVNGSPASVAVGDFNNDGLMDLTATSAVTTTYGWWSGGGGYYGGWYGGYYTTTRTDGYVNVLLGHGGGTFDPTRSTWVNSADLGDLAVGDFNGDGRLDVAVADGITPVRVDPTVLLGSGDGTFKAVYHYNGGQGPDAVLVGNFNGDTFPDVATANFYSGDASVFVNDTDWRTLVIGGLPASTTAGQAQTFTVTVRDNAGNVQTGYRGTMHITSNDGQAVLPADHQFTAADAGVFTFTVTFKTAGWQWVTATDTAAPNLANSAGLSVTPAAASTFLISGSDYPVTVGDSGYVSVSAYDAYGNAATNYTGTVRFTSSDRSAVLPGDYTFSEWDYGTGYFYIPLQTAGTQSITVTDLANPGLTATQSGIRVVPRATISGPSAGFRNQALTFTLGADSGLPAGTVYSYAIDWNGDGAVDQTVIGPSGTAVTHNYADTGWNTVGVTATVHIGAEDYTSYTTYQGVVIVAVTVTVQADAGDATKRALVVGGTADADYLTLSRGSGNAIDLYVSGYYVASYSAPGGSAFGHLLMYGYGGDDDLSLSGNLTVPALLFGGNGSDYLDADGSSANNVLVGEAGADYLCGGSGRDLMIGGAGADELDAAYGGAILIGGSTDYDNNVAALLALMKEWGRTDVNYDTRVKHLNGSSNGGLNGSTRLTSKTVHDDSAVDYLYGWDGLDWYVVSGSGKKKDKVYDKTSKETVTTI
jgi:FG-GAP-like repeat/RTX calcium-binding nonapeptide repeat (4 copies)